MWNTCEYCKKAEKVIVDSTIKTGLGTINLPEARYKCPNDEGTPTEGKLRKDTECVYPDQYDDKYASEN